MLKAIQSRCIFAVAFSLFTLAVTPWLQSSEAIQANTSISIVSAGSYQAPVTPDGIASLFGVALSAQTDKARTRPLPTSLAGVTVRVNNVPAGLFFVSPGQINFLIPANTSVGIANISVTASDGSTRTGTVEIVKAAPALFTFNGTGAGVAAAVALRVRANNTQSYESIAQFDQASNRWETLPLNLGAPSERLFLVLYGSGVRGVANSVRVLMGGVEVTPSYVGPAGDFFGTDQINVELTRSLIGRGRLNISLIAPNTRASNVADIDLANVAADVPNGPTIANILPAQAIAGETLTITGSGFSTAASGNAIIVGGVETRTVESVSASQLVVRVPFGITSGKLAVRNNQGEALSPNTVNALTTVSGVITDTQGNPLPNVAVSIGGRNATTRNDGSYTVKDVASAQAVLRIDPSSLPLTPKLPIYQRLIGVLGNRDNLQSVIALQPPDNAGVSGQTQGANATGDNLTASFEQSAFANSHDFETAAAQTLAVNLTNGGITFDLADNAVVTLPAGVSDPRIYLTRVENSLAPTPLPRGVFSSALAQLSPFGIRLNPGGKLTFPNPDGWAANSQVTLYRLNQNPTSQSLGSFAIAGTATVSADGQRIETSPNAITETSIYFVANARPTTTVIGRVVDSDNRPVRFALVSSGGQQAFTDGNGSFVIMNVPVPASGQLALDVNYIRPSGRTDRVKLAGIIAQALSVTRITPDLVLPSPATQPNRPPSLTVPAALYVNAGATRDFPLLVSDPDPNQTVSVTVSGSSAASIVANGNNFVLRITPDTTAVGTVPLTLRATDSLGAITTRIVALTVLANRPPVLFVPGAQTIAPNQTVSFNVFAADPDDNQTLSFSSTNLPAGATLTPNSATSARFNWTPAANSTSVAVSFTVRDNGSPQQSDTKSVTINIQGAPGNITGVVRNASTGAVLPNAALNIVGTNLIALADANGAYTLNNIPSGARTLSARADGFTPTEVPVTIVAGQTVTQNISLSPILAAGQIRITVNWTKNGNLGPRDLDAYLTGPTTSGTCFRVYFGNDGSLTESPFAALEVDNIGLDGAPPTETIRIAQRFNGTYRFYVNNFSEEEPDGLSKSRATVQIFNGNNLVRTYVVPAGAGDYWTVFEMNGATGALTDINRLGTIEPDRTCGLNNFTELFTR